MQLDTKTASEILKSAAQCNAVAEQATQRVVELMQEAIEYRERIEELEVAVRAALSYIQNQPGSQGYGHAEMMIAALRGALAKRERD